MPLGIAPINATSFDLDANALTLAIQHRQWTALINALPAVCGGLLVSGLAFIAMAYGQIAKPVLGLWAACFMMSTSLVGLFYIHHRKDNTWFKGWSALSKQFMACIRLQAAVWGIGLAVIMPNNNLLAVQSLVLLIAILTGGPLALAAHFPSLASFAVVLILPFGILFTLNGDHQMRILGLASLPCLVMYIQAAWLLCRNLLDAYRAVARDKLLLEALQTERAQIEIAKDNAERANQAKSRFLAAASHDLRQPMHAIGLLVGALEQDIRNEKNSRLFKKIVHSVDRLDSLFNRLLDVSKLEAGKVQAQPAWVSSAQILNNLETLHASAAAQRGLELRFRDAAKCSIQTDPDLLEQVLNNLISNALRYTFRGGVLVAARIRRGNLVLQVWDTGIGIPGDNLDNVFDEFVQLDHPEHSRTRGLGLGLAIVRRVGHLLQAEVCAKSRLGKGSLFEITLPRAERKPCPVEAHPPHTPGMTGMEINLQEPAASDSLAGLYILVVDDEPDILLGMQASLGRGGCYVHTAQTLAQTLSWLESTERLPDALVVDYRLGDPNEAWEIIQHTREACAGELAVLMISGEMGEALERRAAQESVTLLRKPLSLTDLEANLLRTLRCERPAF